MAEIKIGKKDLAWSYIAQFLSMGAGIITLPFILNKLSAAEIGLNYILITVGSIIALVDLGFAPQFARNFTFVFSGAQELKKEGIGQTKDEVNYELLSQLLKTARYIYLILGIVAIALLLAIGTPYLYETTNGFTSVPNALLVWIIYSFGVLFQIFYSYYFSMLLGAGKVKEQKQALIVNKLLNITILLSCLYLGLGLLSVALAQLISPFAGRWMSYRCFYTSELRSKLTKNSEIARDKILEIFHILWYNAKRTAIMSIGAYAILKLSMFIAGLYLTLEEFATYGLMVQLVNIIGQIGSTYMQTVQPQLASLNTKKENNKLLSEFSLALQISYLIIITGSLILILFGNSLLLIIKSNAALPNNIIVTIYSVVMFLEYNHSNFSVLISINNHVPFAPASIATGIAVTIGTFLVLKFTSCGILGLVLVQGICQLAYQNWKWPKVALEEYNINFLDLIKMGYLLLVRRFRFYKNVSYR